MKALITIGALGIGIGAAALAATVQHDPFAFQAHQRQMAFAGSLALVDHPTQRQAAPPPPAATPEMAPVVEKRTPAPRPRRVQRTVAHKAPEVENKVLPAPCRHGQYRKLEPGRGVWLMCPGQF